MTQLEQAQRWQNLHSNTDAAVEVEEYLSGQANQIQQLQVLEAVGGAFRLSFNDTYHIDSVDHTAHEWHFANATKNETWTENRTGFVPWVYRTTGPIPHNATAQEVEDAINEQLNGLNYAATKDDRHWAGFGTVKVERITLGKAGSTPRGFRWLILNMGVTRDQRLLEVNNDTRYTLKTSDGASTSAHWAGASMARTATFEFYRSTADNLDGNFSLRFPWTQECDERPSGVWCEPASTVLMPVCTNESHVEHSLEKLGGVGDVSVRRTMWNGISLWNGTIMEDFRKVCRYEIQFHDVVANASGRRTEDESPHTWAPHGPYSDEAVRMASPTRGDQTSADLPKILVNTSHLTGTGAEVDVQEVQPGVSYEAGGKVALEVTQNGQDYSDSRVVFEYLPVAQVTSLEPRHGPVYGGTEVLVRGRFFRNSSLLTCQFGNKVSC